MRLVLFILGISVWIVAIVNRAEGQNYPWCWVYRDGVMIFRSLLFCNARRLAAGGVNCRLTANALGR
jgi:hypothetical protein